METSRPTSRKKKKLSIGEIFGKVRSERENTQDYYCGGRLSRKTLWNFEHNLSNISYDSYVYLLDKLNVSAEEMDYLEASQIPGEFSASEKFQKKSFEVFRMLEYKEASKEEVERWMEKGFQRYEETLDFFYKHFAFSMKKLLKDKFDSELDLSEEVTQVTDRLMRIETYTDLDLSLFVNFLEYLQEPLIFSVERELQERLAYDPIKYGHFSYYFVLRTKYFFRLGRFPQHQRVIAYYLKCLYQCTQFTKTTYPIMVLHRFFSDLYKIKKEEQENQAVNHHLETFRYFGDLDEYTDCYQLLNEVLFDMKPTEEEKKRVPFIL